MATPSLFPLFLKAAAGGVAGTVFIETFGLEILETVNIEVAKIVPDVEVVEQLDVEVVEGSIDVEIP